MSRSDPPSSSSHAPDASSGASHAATAAVASIELSTCLLIPEQSSDRVPLGEHIATVQALVQDIGRRTRMTLIDHDGELIDFLDVKLNGKNIHFHPAGLATPLQADDRVYIGLVPIGGG